MTNAPNRYDHCHEGEHKKGRKYEQPGELGLVLFRVVVLNLHVQQDLEHQQQNVFQRLKAHGEEVALGDNVRPEDPISRIC